MALVSAFYEALHANRCWSPFWLISRHLLSSSGDILLLAKGNATSHHRQERPWFGVAVGIPQGYGMSLAGSLRFGWGLEVSVLQFLSIYVRTASRKDGPSEIPQEWNVQSQSLCTWKAKECPSAERVTSRAQKRQSKDDVRIDAERLPPNHEKPIKHGTTPPPGSLLLPSFLCSWTPRYEARQPCHHYATGCYLTRTV